MSNLTGAISYLSDLIAEVLEETLDATEFDDLTQQQLHYLKVIVKLGNPTLTELAKELGVTRPTVTVLVDKLAEKGYIKRVKSDEDRRVMHLHIDKKGAKINTLREAAHERVTEIIRSDLSETETEVLTGLLIKIARHSG